MYERSPYGLLSLAMPKDAPTPMSYYYTQNKLSPRSMSLVMSKAHHPIPFYSLCIKDNKYTYGIGKRKAPIWGLWCTWVCGGLCLRQLHKHTSYLY